MIDWKTQLAYKLDRGIEPEEFVRIAKRSGIGAADAVYLVAAHFYRQVNNWLLVLHNEYGQQAVSRVVDRIVTARGSGRAVVPPSPNLKDRTEPVWMWWGDAE